MLKRSLTFIQGLCWFSANDPSVPEDVRQAWSQWGVCKDEFQDHGGWPRMLYVRNGRRMISDFVLTEAHGRKENQVAVEDAVALVWWPFDLHNARRIVKGGAAWNEGTVFGGYKWAPFGVSYRSVVPKAAECVNLLTPTCPSSSYVAYGAIRLEWTFMVMGQSVATAAVLAMDSGVPVQQLDYQELKLRLEKDAQVLDVP
ncbi:FAD-dependent oxidoreductase [Verrucomicrobium spinosum]|uniref:FAD-dependent oxidoreductase n=1 Tax=Verrucomicrobium spinosum TaxID=2736 RepID=UPI000A93BAF3